eukprot:TRINITY_DN47598_c0_g2_i1.p1 TRINITY_DN47598_c0_g2~~TRINITY_DN47598_c0_g2_i1.p1  ORF type:complete len:242 (-),score=44.17 TRINITY_DN47598_c0_g2_i1:25-750(-)
MQMQATRSGSWQPCGACRAVHCVLWRVFVAGIIYQQAAWQMVVEAAVPGHLVEVAEVSEHRGAGRLVDARSASTAWLASKEAEVRALTAGAERMRARRLKLEDAIAAVSRVVAKDPTKHRTHWRPSNATASGHKQGSVSTDKDIALLRRSLLRRDRSGGSAASSRHDVAVRGVTPASHIYEAHGEGAVLDPACCNTADWVDSDGQDCNWYLANLQKCDDEARQACCICNLGRRPDQSCGRV